MMQCLSRLSLMASLLMLICVRPVGAQGLGDQDSEKINSSLGIAVAVPVKPTSDLASLGWGVTAGVGYNFNRYHSLIGEFMWNRLYSTSGANISGSTGESSGGTSGIYSVTGNYRFELRGRKFGTYLIGGGGWYYRHNDLDSHVAVNSGTSCTPSLVWWGATCTSGTVTSNQTLSSYGVGALGANAGLGFTWKVNEPSYRFYVESRYHYAPTNNINTQFVNCTIGIRY
jgi:Outer membrane protein beta-barrel domain